MPSVANKSSAKKLILWDIDGTIIVSHGAGVRAMEKALTKRFGVACDLGKIDWAGRTDSWITGEVFRHVGLPDTPQNAHDYLEAYLELLPAELREGRQGQVLPGVLNLLEHLHHRKDLAQGLLTGNLRRGAELKLPHYTVWHYFEFGAFADDSRALPSPSDAYCRLAAETAMRRSVGRRVGRVACTPPSSRVATRRLGIALRPHKISVHSK